MAPLTDAIANHTLVKLKPVVNSDQWDLFSPELNKESAGKTVSMHLRDWAKH